tara:strand:+ start:59 stop:430 length:372 start_codon:yes stop_codon:yes gene_type:complete
MSKILSNLKSTLKYADSEFLELLIAILHTFLLPVAVITEMGFKWHVISIAVLGGLFQLYSVGIKDLRCRYYSCGIATIVSLYTALNYAFHGLLAEAPSRYGWVIIAFAAIINQIRITKQYKGF